MNPIKLDDSFESIATSSFQYIPLPLTHIPHIERRKWRPRNSKRFSSELLHSNSIEFPQA